MDDRYLAWRAEFEEQFEGYQPVPDSTEVSTSPSGRFRLATTRYTAGPSTWSFSRGIVVDTGSGEELADIKRNYGVFWHAWVQHPNGNEYLLCGEDYQGYVVLNLTQRATRVHFPEAGYAGHGFCWSAVHPSPDGQMLAVEGCFWACDYDLVFYDFRDPDRLPLAELQRIARIGDVEGWVAPDTLRVERIREVRTSDGAAFDTLSEEEQERLANDWDLLETMTDAVDVERPTPADPCVGDAPPHGAP